MGVRKCDEISNFCFFTFFLFQLRICVHGTGLHPFHRSHCVSESVLLCSSCFHQLCLPLSIFFDKDKNWWFFLWLVIVHFHGIYFVSSFRDSKNTDSLSQFICSLQEISFTVNILCGIVVFHITLSFLLLWLLLSTSLPFPYFCSRISCFTYSSGCLYLAQMVWIYFARAVMVEWTCYYICRCSWYNDYCCFNTTFKRNKNVTMKHTWINSPQCVISFFFVLIKYLYTLNMYRVV